METRTNLLNFDRANLGTWFTEELGEKSYRANQVIQWLYQKSSRHIEEMTNLSKDLRQRLVDSAEIRMPEIAMEQVSRDGTCKWLLRLECGNCIETVFIPEETRGTLCISSQIGCALDCSFCATGKQGFNRNLTVAEIIGQLRLATMRLQEMFSDQRRISNVVMMGMGEPLLNFDAVVQAMNLMLDDMAYGLSKYRVTLSTSGVVPAMEQLAKVSDVSLALSLHAPNDELRNVLVPINRKYPLKVLMETCRNYFPTDSKRHITMEYVMLKEVNDQPKHAQQLIQLLEGIPVKINLIPFNTFPGVNYICSEHSVIQRFQAYLIKAGLNTRVRKTRGDDIDAACGQLTGKVEDRTRRTKLLAKKLIVN